MICAALLAFALLFASFQQGQPTPEERERLQSEGRAIADRSREQSIRVNDLMGHIQTEADARRAVDALTEIFHVHLKWVSPDIRRRVAQAEYMAATDSSKLIPEERIASVWNEYVREIGAAGDAIVTEKELHSLRDLKYATAKVMWSRGWNQSIWTIPNVYATAPDGRLAGGCRVLEAFGLLYELNNHFDNVQTAKKLAAASVSASDQIQRAEEKRRSLDRQHARVELRATTSDENPIHVAERRYISQRGSEAMYVLVLRLLDEMLPGSSTN